jgi:hypothetical protein
MHRFLQSWEPNLQIVRNKKAMDVSTHHLALEIVLIDYRE